MQHSGNVLALAVQTSGEFADLVYEDGKLLASGRDLETACLTSLFTDAPALAGDALDEGTPRRGYWADRFDGQSMGSRLWLLEGAEVTAANAARAESYAREALRWLVSRRIVRAVDVSSELHPEAIYVAVDITLRDRAIVRLGPFNATGATQ